MDDRAHNERPGLRPKPAFPKRTPQPSVVEFPARLSLEQGKRFEALREYLLKQKSVSEELFYYGPKTGWGLRYQRDGQPLCALLIHGDRPVGVLSLDRDTDENVDWDALSPIGRQARENANGSPSLLWIDLPLDGRGANDLKVLLRAKASPRAQRPAPDTKRKAQATRT